MNHLRQEIQTIIANAVFNGGILESPLAATRTIMELLQKRGDKETEWWCDVRKRWVPRSECFIWYPDGNNPEKPGHEVKPGHERCEHKSVSVIRILN